MISDETRRKFEIIVRNMNAHQRAVLQDHLASVPDSQKFALIEQIVAKYEQQGAFSDTPAQPPVKTSSQEKPEPRKEIPKEIKPPKKKLKKSVKNTFLGFFVAILAMAILLLTFFYKDKLFEKTENNLTETQVQTAVTEPSETTPSPTPTITPTPEPTRVPLAQNAPDLTGLTVVIDPGHQETTDSEQETYASWLSATKPRCTCGTTGIVTDTPRDLPNRRGLMI